MPGLIKTLGLVDDHDFPIQSPYTTIMNVFGLQSSVFSLGLSLLAAIIQPACCNAEPTILKFDEGRMFIPPQFSASGHSFDLLIHFHGDWNVVHRNFERSRLNAVLVVLNYKGLSSAYAKPFRDAHRFQELLEEVTRALRERGIIEATSHSDRIYLTSFSAGYGAVRTILQQPDYFQIVDGILMADSIYAGFERDDRKVDPKSMQAFRHFASAAAEGQKVFVLTHSYLHTPTYASTKETADDLIDFVGAKRDASPPNAIVDMNLQRSHRRKSFVVLGYAGTTGEDHLQHLRHIGAWMPLLKTLESSKQNNPDDN